jgi:hypothetical protein
MQAIIFWKSYEENQVAENSSYEQLICDMYQEIQFCSSQQYIYICITFDSRGLPLKNAQFSSKARVILQNLGVLQCGAVRRDAAPELQLVF